jgi:hypothetical protein
MIARNKPPLRIGTGLNPGSAAQNRRKFVRVPVSYRAFLRARAFRPTLNTNLSATQINLLANLTAWSVNEAERASGVFSSLFTTAS